MSSQINYLGGSFGFATNQWLSSVLGVFGAVLLVLVLLFVAIVALFNPDFKALAQKYLPNKIKKSSAEDESGNAFATVNQEEELEEGEQIDEEEDSEEEEDFEVIFKDDHEKTDEEQEAESDDDFEVVTKKETAEVELVKPEETANDDSGEFSVEVAKQEKELTASDLNKKLEDFGPYDPKLDLSSYTLPPIDLLKKFESNKGGVSKEELEQNKDNIVTTLAHYKIDISKIKATIGPTVTLYEIVPAPGVRISKIKNLEDDIA